MSHATLKLVEDRLVEFKNQEIKFCEKIRGLEFKVESKTDRIECLTKELEELKKEKEGLDTKLTCFQSASKDLDTLIGSQRSDKNNEGLGYRVVPPPAQVYSPPKKDINSSVTETEESSSTILSKPAIKFVKAVDRPAEIKTNKVKTAKKSAVKYAEMYRKTSKSSNDQGKTWAKNNYTHKSRPPRAVVHKTVISPTRTNITHVNSARPQTTQDLMIILIQRVKRLEKELKARTPPTKIHKVNRGRSRGSKSKEVVDCILQVKIKLLIKKLEDSEAEHQV
nr:hypothetical protein [Tanacetum cinerariifolium]